MTSLNGGVQVLYWEIISLHQQKTSSCFLPYLHDGVEGRVGSETEVSARHIVTYGCRQHAHRDAELLVVGPGLEQLQQRLKGLVVVVVAAIR